MCNTGWKKVLERCGRTQRSAAQALNVNQAELSLVMQGRAFLTPEKFNKACELLSCRPTEVYGDDVSKSCTEEQRSGCASKTSA